MSEAEKLTAFLLALQTSPSQRAKFRHDPIGAMERFNLASRTIDAVLERDKPKLWRILKIPVPTQVGHAAGVKARRRRRRRKPT